MGLWLRKMAYEVIPDRRPELRPSAAVLLLCIADRCADGRGELWAKLETMAEWTGSNRSQVSRDLKNLQELDFIGPKLQIHRRPTHWYVFPSQYPEAVANLSETTTDIAEKEKAQEVLRAPCALCESTGARIVWHRTGRRTGRRTSDLRRAIRRGMRPSHKSCHWQR